MNAGRKTVWWLISVVLIGISTSAALTSPASATVSQPYTQATSVSDNPNPPTAPVKLVFIHHSTGGNWLADVGSHGSSGGLGLALMENNYYVSATNYGWGPDGVGDRTDIINWPEWFKGGNSAAILQALYTENGRNEGDYGPWPRLSTEPGGENQIIVFKSCYPNSSLSGNPDDPPAAAPNSDLSVSNAKAVYNSILSYFATRQDKLFIVIAAPPLRAVETTEAQAANARAFNTWLLNDWLKDYPHQNVAVFDFYNVLTSNSGSPSANDAGQTTGNHHRWWNGAVQHVQTVQSNYLAYETGDSHPSAAGGQKATSEFVPLLNVFYHRWKASQTTPPTDPVTPPTDPVTPPTDPVTPPTDPVTPTATQRIYLPLLRKQLSTSGQ